MYQPPTADIFFLAAQSVSVIITMGWLVSRFFALVFYLVHLRQHKHSTRWFVLVVWLFVHPNHYYDSTRAFGLPMCCTGIWHYAAKNWLLAHSIHADYGIIQNLMGEFLTFKGQLYMPKKIGTDHSVWISWRSRTFWSATDLAYG